MEKRFVWTADSFADEAALHQFVREHLAAQNAYGNNLSAMFDILTSVRDVTLVLEEDWDMHLGPRTSRIHQLLLDAAEENPTLTIIEKSSDGPEAQDKDIIMPPLAFDQRRPIDDAQPLRDL